MWCVRSRPDDDLSGDLPAEQGALPDRGYSKADLAEYSELMALPAIYHELLGLIPNARSLN